MVFHSIINHIKNDTPISAQVSSYSNPFQVGIFDQVSGTPEPLIGFVAVIEPKEPEAVREYYKGRNWTLLERSSASPAFAMISRLCMEVPMETLIWWA